MEHRRVDIQGSAISCGVTQISRLSDEQEGNLFAIATRFYHAAHGQPPAFVIWSNLADQVTNGHRIAHKIDELGFGQVLLTNPEVNPNTGALICVWVWQVNHEKFKEWYKEAKVQKLKGQYPTKKV